MLQLTLAAGGPVAVNPAVIATVEPHAAGALITLTSTRTLEVSEPFEALAKALGATPIEQPEGPVGFAVAR